MASSNFNRAYEDFDPPSDVVSEEQCDTILLYLPGFNKEQLRVQLTQSRMIKISGERPIGENIWRRFHKEYRVPSNCDTKEITAKFEGGILFIRQPKVIAPVSDKGKTGQETPKPEPPQPQTQPMRDQAPTMGTEKEEGEKMKDEVTKKDEITKKDELAEKDEITQAPMSEAQTQAKQQEEAPPSEMPKMEEVKKEEREEKKEKAGKVEMCERRPSQVFRRSELFRELRKPEKMKKLIISVVLVLGIGFYVTYVLKSFTGNGRESRPGFDQVE